LEAENKRYLDLLIKHTKGERVSVQNAPEASSKQSDSY
jgi:hypothetical protein